MRGKNRVWFVLLVACTAWLASCQETINYPAPSITALSIASINAGEPTMTLTVTGGNLTPATTVNWVGPGTSGNAATLVTYFMTTGQIQATVPASLIQTPGTAQITLITPQPGGGTSLALPFTINGVNSPVPHISSLSPSGVLAGTGGFTLDLTGSNFLPISSVIINGTAMTAMFETINSLEVSSVPASLVASAGSLQITVVNPPPGGGSSNQMTLPVNNPVPTIISVNPTSQTAGSAATSLAVTGMSFTPTSTILINGAPRVTTFGSATSVATMLTTADFVQGGPLQVQVTNPAPGGGSSNILPLSVIPSDTAGLPVLVDYGPLGVQANNGICGGPTSCQSGSQGLTQRTSGPSLSNTGEFVAFASVSSNLVTGQPSAASEIFLRDTCLGSASCTPTTYVASLTASGTAPNGASSQPSLSNGGTQVAYTSLATNLTNYVTVAAGTSQIYWQTVTTSPSGSTPSTSGTPAANAAVLVSISADSTTAGNGASYDPAISPDGRYVAFVSLATNLVSNAHLDGVTPQVFLRDTCSGVTPLTQASNTCVPTTFLVSSPDGVSEGNGAGASPTVSSGGTYVAFQSAASNLGAQAPNKNNLQEIFVQNQCLGSSTCPFSPPLLVSTPQAGGVPASGASVEPAISSDGRFIAFASTATNLGVTSGVQQIYLRDQCLLVSPCTPSTTLISTTDGVTPGNLLSENPSINQNTTASGQFVAFASQATNLATNVANGVENIFVRNTCLTEETTTTACAPNTVLVSQGAGTAPPAANGNSLVPVLSGDTHTVAFFSFASNLVANDNNGLEDIFLAASSF